MLVAGQVVPVFNVAHLQRGSRGMKLPNLILLLAALLIVGCGSSGKRNTVETGGQTINYGPVAGSSSLAPDGFTPLLFTFSQSERLRLNGATEADFQREADLRGISVQTAKLVFGNDPYFGPDGRMRSCIILAIEKGLCKGPRTLPISERVRLVQQIVNQDPNCSWRGFDPVFNRQMSIGAGAPSYTLWIAAAC